jgi:hypothetical protein
MRYNYVLSYEFGVSIKLLDTFPKSDVIWERIDDVRFMMMLSLINLGIFLQRFMHYIKGLPFENPELINKKFEIKVRTLVGWELSRRYLETMKDILDECRVDYHDAVNKGIQDFKFETQLHEREKLVAMMIFPLKGTKAPYPR